MTKTDFQNIRSKVFQTVCILFLLISLDQIPCKSQEIKMECSSSAALGIWLIDLSIDNPREESIFVLISHWEADGIKDSTDLLVAFPETSYVVNSIYFAPLRFRESGIPARGTKADFPDYVMFPSVLEIPARSNRSITLSLNESTLPVSEKNKYFFDISLHFCTRGGWSNLRHLFGKRIDDAIIKDNNLMIQIEDRRILTVLSSNVRVDSTKSFTIRAQFAQAITSQCLTD